MVNAEYYEKQVARIGKRLKAARADYMKEYWQGELAKMCAAQQKYALDAASAAPVEHDTNSEIVPAGEVDSQPRQQYKPLCQKGRSTANKTGT